MSELTEPFLVASRLASTLDRLGVDYLVGGSVASSVHGLPRATNDVDMVARLGGTHVQALVEDLSDEFYIDEDMIRDAIARRGSFNVIHLATMLKADIFIFDGSPLATEEMRRRIRIELQDNRSMWFSSAEDIILEKLEWYRKGGGTSERQWSDVLGVLRVQGARLDREYLVLWATRTGLLPLLERAFTSG